MEDRHLTLALLRAVHAGERSSGDMATVALSHLFDLCPHCREVFESWRWERLDQEDGQVECDGQVAAHKGEARRRRPAEEEERPATGGVRTRAKERVVPGDTPSDRMREILALPNGERVEGVRRNPSRYSGPELSRLLLTEGRGHLPAEPGQAYALASLARAVLQHGNTTPETIGLYALAVAHQGNALRAQGELLPAEELLEAARFLFEAHGAGSTTIRAELDSFEGSLRWAQRRFSEAEAHLSRAVAACAADKRPVEAARALLKLGSVHSEADEFDRAIECSRRACEIFSDHGQTKLLLMARHNLAWDFMEAGDVERSRATLAASHELYDQFTDSWTQLRRLWLEGRLAKTEGNVEAAEDAFRAVQQGFLEQGVGYDAALAALDLAFLYAERGRTAELKRVAEEIVPVFEAQDVHREAAAALMLFQEAVRAERASVRFLGELSRYLEQARRDPELRFRQPPEQA